MCFSNPDDIIVTSVLSVGSIMCITEIGLSYTTSIFGERQLQDPLQRGQNPISHGICSVLSVYPSHSSAKEQLNNPFAARGGGK